MFHVKHRDGVRSTRFFWWRATSLSFPKKLFYAGTEENCNRTVGVRLPGGVFFICLNIPLRQEPCDKCST